MDWAARFETGGRMVEGAVVDVSEGGLRIADDRELPAGAEGTLTVIFRGLEDRIEVVRVAATVVWSGELGVAVTYAGLPGPAARRLHARFLTGEARRRSPRARVALPVQVRPEGEEPIGAETVDLSAYSARVTPSTPLKAGARVELLVSLEAGKTQMAVPALVWQVDDSGEAVLMFTNLLPADFSRLGDYVSMLAERKG
jgi:hypothetical protein